MFCFAFSFSKLKMLQDNIVGKLLSLMMTWIRCSNPYSRRHDLTTFYCPSKSTHTANKSTSLPPTALENYSFHKLYRIMNSCVLFMNCLIKMPYHKQLAMILLFKEKGEKGGLKNKPGRRNIPSSTLDQWFFHTAWMTEKIVKRVKNLKFYSSWLPFFTSPRGTLAVRYFCHVESCTLNFENCHRRKVTYMALLCKTLTP